MNNTINTVTITNKIINKIKSLQNKDNRFILNLWKNYILCKFNLLHDNENIYNKNVLIKTINECELFLENMKHNKCIQQISKKVTYETVILFYILKNNMCL